MTITEDINSPWLDAELWAENSIRADGSSFDRTTPKGISEEVDAEADGTNQTVFDVPGTVRLRILEDDVTDMALATGVIEEDGPHRVCLLVQFNSDDGASTPAMGQHVVLKAEGVQLAFLVAISHDDLHTPVPAEFDLGPNAIRNEAFDSLDPGQAVLVQVLQPGVVH